MAVAKDRKGKATANVSAARRASPALGERELEKRRKIAEAVKLHLAEQKMSRATFVEMVGRSHSTANHFFAGVFSDSYLALVERKLGRTFGGSSSVAPVDWGEYTQEGTEKFAGSYLTLRCDFENPDQVCAYVTTIEWASTEQAQIYEGRVIQKPKTEGYGLVFREEQRVEEKYTHRGQVWFPGQFLYLVTAYGDGRLRAAIVSLPDNGRMSGVQLSLYNPMGSAFVPAASPIVLLKKERISKTDVGNILPGHECYGEYRREIEQAMAEVVLAVPSKQLAPEK